MYNPNYSPYDQYNQNPNYSPYDQYNQNPNYSPYDQYNQNPNYSPYDRYNQNPNYSPYDQYNQNPNYSPYNQYNQNPNYSPYNQYNQNRPSGTMQKHKTQCLKWNSKKFQWVKVRHTDLGDIFLQVVSVSCKTDPQKSSLSGNIINPDNCTIEFSDDISPLDLSIPIDYNGPIPPETCQ